MSLLPFYLIRHRNGGELCLNAEKGSGFLLRGERTTAALGSECISNCNKLGVCKLRAAGQAFRNLRKGAGVPVAKASKRQVGWVFPNHHEFQGGGWKRILKAFQIHSELVTHHGLCTILGIGWDWDALLLSIFHVDNFKLFQRLKN